ncbi:MAG: CPBP family intramembrane metalloprotease [Ruminiclostridium sp.]|nr:CPBP family intramembrane metalloprotease [Ruminiclostridium sp.]
MQDDSITAVGGIDLMPQYKKSALLVSTYFMVVFVLRYIAVIIINAVAYALRESAENAQAAVDYDTLFLIEIAISGTFLQVLPSVIGAFMFRYLGKNGKGIACLYRIPKSCSRAVGDFGAVYGLAHGVNVITIIVMYILTSKADIMQKANTVSDMPKSIVSAWGMFFMLVVIAPLFEEFMFRGLVLNELRPYGSGLAIFVSGVMFGVFHGNFQQCFYTAAAGIAMGYIAYVTGSLVPTTVIHMIMNGLAGILTLLMSTDPVQKYILNGDSSEIPESDMLWVAAFGIFVVCILILILVGVIMAVLKLRQILRHKPKKVWSEVSGGKKLGVLLLTVPSVITLIMIIDVYGKFSEQLIAKLFGGT